MSKFNEVYNQIMENIIKEDGNVWDSEKSNKHEVRGTFASMNINIPQTIDGDFICSGPNKFSLTTLKGGPQVVTGSFDCHSNKLTTLEHAPKEVGNSFNCADNKLGSLKGIPKKIGKDFICAQNNLSSLEGCPEVVKGYFDCSANDLKSLEGCPKEVHGNFGCGNNPGKFTEENVRAVCKVKGKVFTK